MELKKEGILATLLIITSLIIFIYFRRYYRELDSMIASLGIIGPLATLLLFALLAITPITTDPVAVIAASIFNPFVAILIIWVGNVIGAFIEYYIGHTIGKKRNYHEQLEQLPFGLDKLPIASPWVLIAGRMLPGVGGKIIGIAAGVYNVPRLRFLWTTLLVNLIGALLITGGTHGLRLIV